MAYREPPNSRVVAAMYMFSVLLTFRSFVGNFVDAIYV
jgi:hypothetical protein